MSLHFITLVGCVVLSGAAACYFLVRRLRTRIERLEQDLQSFSEAMCQMAEIQMKGYQKLDGDVGEIEERILDLSVPARDSSMTLERRHQVLALSRKGAHVDQIVKRLNLPRGEAELILNLQKFKEVAASKSVRPEGGSKRYAQA